MIQRGEWTPLPKTTSNLIFGQLAGSAVGARNRIADSFSGRGFADSPLLQEELGRVERTLQGGQAAAVSELLNAARGERARSQGQLQSLLFGIPSTQGASAAGVGLSSLSQILGFLLALQAAGRRSGD